MLKIASDFLYNDKSSMQMLAGLKEKDDNGYYIKILTNAVKSCVENGLTKKQKMYIDMYYYQSKKIPQIAKEVGVNKSTVSRSLNAAREKIRRQLKFVAIQ